MSKNKPLKVLTIVGARPQFIKSATVSRLINLERDKIIKEVIVHTGQHYDDNMSDLFFRELEIPTPLYNLNVGSGSHAQQTGAIMIGLEKIVNTETPDIVLVYGDTNSTLAGALVAAKTSCKLVHVEAGLRSYRRGMPEEVNRVVTDNLSDILFCPTITAKDNLVLEGKGDNSLVVGDVMYDSYLYYSDKLDINKVLNNFGLQRNQYLLATIHRAENTDHPKNLKSIFSALKTFLPDMDIVLPLHPRTKKVLKELHISLDGFNVIDPVSYQTMISLLSGSRIVVTDSGGLQKEAYFAKTPCVTVRDETEWVETLVHGWNRISPPSNKNDIVSSIKSALDINTKNSTYIESYGDGHASEKILNYLLERT
jgi:UDP-N-acetylglucosamine 2-epimerase